MFEQNRFVIKATYKNRRKRNPQEYVEQADIQERIYLKNKALLKKNKIYSIIFNVDKKGSTKLPDGSVESINLNALNDRLLTEYQIVDKEGKGMGLKWVIDTDHHKSIPEGTLLKDYVDDRYPI